MTSPAGSFEYHKYKRYIDPLAFQRVLWPNVVFYREQEEVIYSVRDNVETICVAGHQLGKDFVTGFIVLWYFLTHHPCRVITTSVKDDHLRVLWGEIGRYITTSKYPLTSDKGGPLVMKHRDIGKIVKGQLCDISYLRGMVSEKGEGLAGHHAPYTLFVADEASGVDVEAYRRSLTWSKRRLILGNPYGGPGHWFHDAAEGGDVLELEEYHAPAKGMANGSVQSS